MRKLKGLKCILLIDDDEINNFMNKELIEKAGIDVYVEVALNGKVALDYLTCSGEFASNKENPQPGLIFLDINMPLMNGWEFLEAYNKLEVKYKGKRIIAMLSSSNNPDDIKRAQEMGGTVGFLNKPLRMNKFVELVYHYFPE